MYLFLVMIYVPRALAGVFHTNNAGDKGYHLLGQLQVSHFLLATYPSNFLSVDLNNMLYNVGVEVSALSNYPVRCITHIWCQLHLLSFEFTHTLGLLWVCVII